MDQAVRLQEEDQPEKEPQNRSGFEIGEEPVAAQFHDQRRHQRGDGEPVRDQGDSFDFPQHPLHEEEGGAPHDGCVDEEEFGNQAFSVQWATFLMITRL